MKSGDATSRIGAKGARVALWAGSSLANVGDQLLAIVTQAELARRLPNALFEHFCPWSRATNPRPLSIDVSGNWSGSGMFDAVVVAGGGVFSGPPFRHSLMQMFCLGSKPARFDPGVAVAWHGVGVQDGCVPAQVGPAPERRAQLDYLEALARRLDYVAVRDAVTANKLAEAGFRKPRVIPDPVFALEPRPRPRTAWAKRPRIGVAVGAAQPSGRFLAALGDPDLANRCLGESPICLPPRTAMTADITSAEQQRRCLYFVGLCASLLELAKHADLDILSMVNAYSDDEIARTLAVLVPSVRLRPVSASVSKLSGSSELERVLSEYDGVLVSRYHAVVLAMRTNTPVVVVDPFGGMNDQPTKLAQLMGAIGLSRRYWTPVSYSEDWEGAAQDIAQAMLVALGDDSAEADLYIVNHRAAQMSFDLLATFVECATKL